MSDYGQDVIDRGLERLKGTWTYNGDEYNLIVEDIPYSDFELIQDYTQTLAPAMRAMENGDDPEDVDIDVDEINERVANLGTFSWEDEDAASIAERDIFKPLVEEKLVKPEVDPTEVGSAKIQALGQGMMEAWREADDIAEARDEMPIDKGNA